MKIIKNDLTNALPLIGYGVYYTDFKNYKSINKLVDEIEENKKSKNIKYILLDGFDECHEYLRGYSSASGILNSFFYKLNNKNIFDGISRVIITSRVDMLENEGISLESLSTKTLIDGIISDQLIDVIKMNYFTKKQIMHRYKMIDKIYRFKNYLMIKRKLYMHISKEKNSIFRIPFFIRYANILFEDTNNLINDLSFENGLCYIINSCIEKEYKLYKEIDIREPLKTITKKQKI